MNDDWKELEYLERIANLKWANGFKCPKCKSEKEPNKGRDSKPFSKRCKDCSAEISPIQGTMFEGSKLSISKTFELLSDFQNTLAIFICKKYHVSELEEMQGIRKLLTLAKYTDISTEGDARDSLSEMYKQHNISENSISLLIDRIYTWMPKKEAIQIPPISEWFKGITTKDSISRYTAFYNFIIKEGREQLFEIVDEDEMLAMAVLKKSYYSY